MLYQRVRPSQFDQIIGNKPAVIALEKAVAAGDRAHCYLFRGGSGQGKTTMARILAQELGCHKINIIEINAASERGIETVRKLEQDAQFSPMGGGNRIIILDEVHMLTREASNALLKLLEDIPEYLYYALCSTNPEKIIKTIRTRCDQIEVKPLRPPEMTDLLLDACERAGIDDPSEEVVKAIVKASAGCPRSALVLLEKQDGLSDEDGLRVVESFEANERDIIDLCRGLGKKRWPDLAKVYKGVMVAEPDTEKVRRALLGYLHTCLASGGADAGLLADRIEELAEPTYDSGKAGLLAMIYRAHFAGKE